MRQVLANVETHQLAPSGSTFTKSLKKIGIVGVLVNEGTNDAVADGVHRHQSAALDDDWKESKGTRCSEDAMKKFSLHAQCAS